jgi:hypothetical protein
LVDDIGQLGQAAELLGASELDRAGQASLHVVAEDGHLNALQRGVNGGELLENIHAEARFLDHPLDPADLAFDAAEARADIFLVRLVEHVWSTSLRALLRRSTPAAALHGVFPRRTLHQLAAALDRETGRVLHGYCSVSRGHYHHARTLHLVGCTVLAAALIAVSDAGCVGRHVAGRVPATISGILHEPDAPGAVARRDVVAVNTATGRTFHTRTSGNGGYTMRVPPGTYRLNVVLRGREVLSTLPSPITVEAGDIKADADLVIAANPR